MTVDRILESCLFVASHTTRWVGAIVFFAIQPLVRPPRQKNPRRSPPLAVLLCLNLSHEYSPWSSPWAMIPMIPLCLDKGMLSSWILAKQSFYPIWHKRGTRKWSLGSNHIKLHVHLFSFPIWDQTHSCLLSLLSCMKVRIRAIIWVLGEWRLREKSQDIMLTLVVPIEWYYSSMFTSLNPCPEGTARGPSAPLQLGLLASNRRGPSAPAPTHGAKRHPVQWASGFFYINYKKKLPKAQKKQSFFHPCSISTQKAVTPRSTSIFFTHLYPLPLSPIHHSTTH